MNPNLPPPPRCVAVLRFSAAGDLILTGPALAALHAAWPNTQLLIVTHARLAPLAERIAGTIAQVVALKPQQSLWQLARTLRTMGVDAVLDLHGSVRSRLLTTLIRPKTQSVWHKRSLYVWAAVAVAHAPYLPSRPMESRYHDAVETLVGSQVAPARHVLALTAADVREANGLLAAAATTTPSGLCGPTTIALVPGAAWATKRWPVGHFAQVGRALLAQGHRVLAVGSPQDAHLTQAIAAAAPGVLNLGGPMSWGAMAHLLGSSHAVVVGDTGPMHLARAGGAPVVALFGSTPASQFSFAKHEALHGNAHCSPCSFYGLAACPRGHLRCLVDIRPERVTEAVGQILKTADKEPANGN